MTVPSLAVSVHDRYTPEVRDRILGSLTARSKKRGVPPADAHPSAHPAEIEAGTRRCSASTCS
jgi:hypothetical protein